jgi:hypothetical protein
MSSIGSVADKQAEEAYRLGRKAVFDVFTATTFSVADIAEQVDIFRRDTQKIGWWISKAISLGELQVHRETKQFSFSDTMAGVLGRNRPINGVVGDPRFDELPPIPPVEAPSRSPITKKVSDLVQYDDVQGFVVTIIASIGGVAWLLRDRVENEVKKYRGWNTGRPTGIRSIIARLMEEGYIENDGSSRYFVYRVTTQGAVKFLGWEEKQAVSLGLKPWIKDAEESPVAVPAVVQELIETSPAVPHPTVVREPRLVDPPGTYPGKDGGMLGDLLSNKSVQRWLVQIVVEIGGVGWVKMPDIVREVHRYEGWHDLNPVRGISRFCGRFIRELEYFDERPRHPNNIKPREVKITKKAAQEVLGWSEEQWLEAIGAHVM